jgi:alkaline phosphatase
MVPVFAYGTGAQDFAGIYENTHLFTKILNLYGFEK